MDNLLEILLPLIFFAIYFAAQFFGSKGEEEEGGGKPVPDELRKVREELRRKIEERRNASKPGGEPGERAQPAAREREREGGSVLRETRTRRSMVDEREEARARGTAREPEVFAPAPAHASTIEEDLEAQMEEVRLSREKVAAARKDSREKSALAATRPRARHAGSPESYRRFLREALNDPENLRRSFILHEVFGTPLGMRRDGQMRASWDL
ncbi:MAG: hypothetical protein ACLFRP_06010 [Puniceicoccaceae bacterium]